MVPYLRGSVIPEGYWELEGSATRTASVPRDALPTEREKPPWCVCCSSSAPFAMPLQGSGVQCGVAGGQCVTVSASGALRRVDYCKCRDVNTGLNSCERRVAYNASNVSTCPPRPMTCGRAARADGAMAEHAAPNRTRVATAHHTPTATPHCQAGGEPKSELGTATTGPGGEGGN